MFSTFLKPKTAVSLYNTALDLYQKGQYPKALKELDKAEALDPELAQVAYTQGLCYQKLDQMEAAKAAFQKALKVNPEDVDSLYNLARLLYNDNELDMALAYAEQADSLAEDPGDEDVTYLLGLIYEQQERWEDAVRTYEKTLQINPDQVLVGTFLAKIYVQLQEFDKAKELLKRLVELDPNNPDVNYEMALSLAKAGDWDEAVTFCRKVVEIDPMNIKGLNQLGLGLYCTQQYEEAIVYYEKALEIDPTYATALNNLAYTYEKVNNYENAVVRFTEYLDYVADKPDEKQALEEHLAFLKTKIEG